MKLFFLFLILFPKSIPFLIFIDSTFVMCLESELFTSIVKK